jgi:hypothetical protein
MNAYIVDKSFNTHSSLMRKRHSSLIYFYYISPDQNNMIIIIQTMKPDNKSNKPFFSKEIDVALQSKSI